MKPKVRNPEVIALLETYLETAKKYHMGHVAISLATYRGEVAPCDFGCCDFAGDVALEKSQLQAVGQLWRKLGGSIRNWDLPHVDEKLDLSHVCYNVAAGPLSFDYMIWLIDAEMTMRRAGLSGPLRVAFWVGREERMTVEGSIWLNNVFRPMLSFIGAVEDNYAIKGHHKELYVPGDIIKAYRAGEKLPVLKPPRVIEPAKRPITITLREAGHWSHRNSTLDAWCRFAKDLMDQGEHVIFIRDTVKSSEPLPGFMTYPLASVDIGERFSLYECAKVNLFVSNGPAGLATYGSRPFLIFIPIEANDTDFIANTPWFWMEKNGVEIGGQYPWFRPDQRFVWERDTYENIVNAWNTHIASGEQLETRDSHIRAVL